MRIDRHRRVGILMVVLVSGLAAACGQTAEQKLARHLANGKALAEQGKHAEAVIEFRGAVAADPGSGEARYHLARAYLATGDVARAIQETSRAADLLPDRNDVQLDAGRLLLLASRFEDAAERARGVLKRDLRNVDALVLLGNASAGISKPDEIVATITAAAKDLPQEPGVQAALGAIERRRGNIAEAEASFKNAVAVAPTSIDAHLALANFYWSVGRFDEVERVLEGAMSLDTGEQVVARNLAFFYSLAGRIAEARPYLEKLVATKPDDVLSAFSLAELYAAEGKLDEARRILEPLGGNPLAGTTATVRLAALEYRAGQKDAAHKRLDAVSGQAKGAAEVAAMRARLLLLDGKLDEALTAARVAAVGAPQWSEGHYLVGAIQLERGHRDEALTALREAEKLAPAAVRPKLLLSALALGRGEIDAAFNYASDAVRLAPGAVQPRIALARALVARRDAAGADEALKPVIAVAGASSDVQVLAGSIAQLKGDREGARRAFTKATELAPASFDAFAGLVGLEVESGRAANAISLVNRRLASAPNDSDLLLLAARVHLAAKDPKQAEALLSRAITAAPDDMRAYEPLAALYFQQGRLDEAAEKFKTIAAKQPSAIGPPTMVGIILQLQGKPKDAQAVYEQLLTAHPEAAVAANNLALLMVQAGGNLDVALNHAQTAKRLIPNDPDVDDTLGVVLTKKQLYSQAIPLLEASTKAKTGNAEYWLHLGQAYAGAERKDDARKALEKALALNPPAALSAEARASLGAIK